MLGPSVCSKKISACPLPIPWGNKIFSGFTYFAFYKKIRNTKCVDCSVLNKFAHPRSVITLQLVDWSEFIESLGFIID